MSGLYLPDKRIVGPDGLELYEVVREPELVGIDLYEADGGADALELIAAIAGMRKRGEKHAALTVRPGGVTTELLVEIELFNKEMYARQYGRELREGEKQAIADAVRRRERRKAKARKEMEKARK